MRKLYSAKKSILTIETAEETQVEEKPKRKRTTPKKKVYDCTTCLRFEQCQNPKLGPSLDTSRKSLFFITPAVTEEADKTGVIMKDKDSSFMRNFIALTEKDISLDRDAVIIPSIACNPAAVPAEQKKLKKQHYVSCFNEKIRPQLSQHNPSHVFLIGKEAFETYYTHVTGWSKKVLAYDKAVGRILPDRERDCWVHVHREPSLCEKRGRDDGKPYVDKNLSGTMKREWFLSANHVMSNWDKRPSDGFEDFTTNYTLLKSVEDIRKVLERLLVSKNTIAFDYETNLLKPHPNYRKIASIAFCEEFEGELISYAFPFQHPVFSKEEQKIIYDLWASVLADPEIEMYAHNMKFEDLWSRYVFPDIKIEGWKHDSMIGAHIVDNRRGITGLKTQGIIQFGIFDYSSKVEKYIQGESSLVENKVFEAPLEELLKYNAMDTLITYKLSQMQMEEIEKYDLEFAYNLFHSSILCLSKIQMNGIHVDVEYYEKKKRELQEEIDGTLYEMCQTDAVKAYEKKYGELPDFNSVKSLRQLFFDVMGQKPAKMTGTGAASVDQESLEKMDNPIAIGLVNVRKLLKLRNTYIAQFEREEYGGVINPFFDLHIPITYRSSSSNPNFQNIPKRDKYAMNLVRGGLKASPGHLLMEVDYGAVEVRGLACNSLDPVIIDYLKNGGDMHWDCTREIFFFDFFGSLDKSTRKTLRGEVKNKFVFPLFYGSYYEHCARDLWETCRDVQISETQTVREWLLEHYKKWITEFEWSEQKKEEWRRKDEYEKFEYRIQMYEQEFWERFQGVRQWQKDMVSLYQKRGYLTSLLGFRYSGYMARNDCFNYINQGFSFHILLTALLFIDEEFEKKNMKSKIIGQIHDAIVLDVNPDELEEVKEIVNRCMCHEVSDFYSEQLCVPLEVEMEITGVDEPWSTIKEVPL